MIDMPKYSPEDLGPSATPGLDRLRGIGLLSANNTLNPELLSSTFSKHPEVGQCYAQAKGIEYQPGGELTDYLDQTGNINPMSAQNIGLVENGGRLFVYLQQRLSKDPKGREGIYNNLWVPPGGKLDKKPDGTMETSFEGAARELSEEAFGNEQTLDPNKFVPIGNGVSTSGTKTFSIAQMLVDLTALQGELKISPEAQGHHLVPFNSAELSKTNIAPFAKGTLLLLAYALEDYKQKP